MCSVLDGVNDNGCTKQFSLSGKPPLCIILLTSAAAWPTASAATAALALAGSVLCPFLVLLHEALLAVAAITSAHACPFPVQSITTRVTAYSVCGKWSVKIYKQCTFKMHQGCTVWSLYHQASSWAFHLVALGCILQLLLVFLSALWRTRTQGSTLSVTHISVLARRFPECYFFTA